MRKRPELRDLRGAAESAARDYADRHRCHDRFLETRLLASGDQQSWKIIAIVDDPGKTVEKSLGFGGLTVELPVYPTEWKGHIVVPRRRKA